jgi:hypothetical protein
MILWAMGGQQQQQIPPENNISKGGKIAIYVAVACILLLVLAGLVYCFIFSKDELIVLTDEDKVYELEDASEEVCIWRCDCGQKDKYVIIPYTIPTNEQKENAMKFWEYCKTTIPFLTKQIHSYSECKKNLHCSIRTLKIKFTLSDTQEAICNFIYDIFGSNIEFIDISSEKTHFKSYQCNVDGNIKLNIEMASYAVTGLINFICDGIKYNVVNLSNAQNLQIFVDNHKKS